MSQKELTPNSAAVEVVDSASLRQFLIAGMKDVMQGRITTWQAKAACNFAQQIYNVTALEVKVTLAQEKLRGKDIRPVSFAPVGSGPSAPNSPPPNNSLGVDEARHSTGTEVVAPMGGHAAPRRTRARAPARKPTSR